LIFFTLLHSQSFPGKQTSLNDEKAQKLISIIDHLGNTINSLGPAQFFPSLINIVPKFKKLLKEARGLASIQMEEFKVIRLNKTYYFKCKHQPGYILDCHSFLDARERYNSTRTCLLRTQPIHLKI
jgi:hypothetical protein